MYKGSFRLRSVSSVRLLDQLLVLGVQGQFPFAQCVISSGLLDLVLVLGVRGQPRWLAQIE